MHSDELPALPSENLVLIDWVSFRCLHMGVDDMLSYLGLSSYSWTALHGFYGFSSRLWCSGINIHYNTTFGENEDGDGCLVEISGSGCRFYETEVLRKCPGLSAAEIWNALFTDLSQTSGFSVTRLDVAFDDHTGLLPMSRMVHDFRHEYFVSRCKSKSCRVEMAPHDKSATLYFGSPKSDIVFRIYDKASERGYDESVHWIRCEMQLRRDNAFSFLSKLVDSDYDLSGLFASVVTNYLRFVNPDKKDTNKRRWKMRRYWSDFVGDALPVSLWIPKTVDYNKAACEKYVYGMAGNSVAALIELDGLEAFNDKLQRLRSKNVSPKIAEMVTREKQLQRVGQFVGSLIEEQNGDAILNAIE